MIKLCAFSDEAAPELDAQIEALLENSIYLTELRSVDGVNIADITEQKAVEIKKKLDDNNIKVWSIGSPVGKFPINENIESHMLKARHIYKLAKILGATNVRIFSFFKAYENKVDVLRLLNQITKEAKVLGLNLCHENEKEVYGDTIARVKELIAGVPELKIIFDPANFVQCGESAKDALKALKGNIFYYHIKDALDDGAIVAAGEGIAAIEDIVKGLDVNTETVLTLEPHLRVFEGYKSIDNSVLKNVKSFASGREAFNYAAQALKSLLEKNGYKSDGKGAYIK